MRSLSSGRGMYDSSENAPGDRFHAPAPMVVITICSNSPSFGLSIVCWNVERAPGWRVDVVLGGVTVRNGMSYPMNARERKVGR